MMQPNTASVSTSKQKAKEKPLQENILEILTACKNNLHSFNPEQTDLLRKLTDLKWVQNNSITRRGEDFYELLSQRKDLDIELLNEILHLDKAILENKLPLSVRSHALTECIKSIIDGEEPLYYLKRMRKLVERQRIFSLTDFDKLDLHDSILDARDAIVSAGPSEDISEDYSFMKHAAVADSAPYPQTIDGVENPAIEQMRNETYQVMRRALDIHFGFGALEFDTKQSATFEHSHLALFGYDICDETHVIHAKSSRDFPGKGLYLKGIHTDRVFATDTETDPFWQYKKSLPWIKEEIDTLDKVDFIFLRGMVAVIPPPDDKLLLDTHYSYIVFNDHFENPGNDEAYLVPTIILKSLLQDSLVPLKKYKNEAETDVNEQGLFLEDLKDTAELLELPIVNITSASCLSGGLCNAFPPFSKPFHEWQTNVYTREWHDFSGHVHKSMILGDENNVVDYLLDMKLEPLREAHNLIYNYTTHCQVFFDLFRFSFANWKKGNTRSYGLHPVKDPLRIQTQDEANKQPENIRMLLAAKDIHESLKSKNAPQADYPILCISDCFSYSSKQPRLLLDTYDLALYDANGNKQDYSLTQEEWIQKIIPHIAITEDIRFLRREVVLNMEET